MKHTLCIWHSHFFVEISVLLFNFNRNNNNDCIIRKWVRYERNASNTKVLMNIMNRYASSTRIEKYLFFVISFVTKTAKSHFFCSLLSLILFDIAFGNGIRLFLISYHLIFGLHWRCRWVQYEFEYKCDASTLYLFFFGFLNILLKLRAKYPKIFAFIIIFHIFVCD